MKNGYTCLGLFDKIISLYYHRARKHLHTQMLFLF